MTKHTPERRRAYPCVCIVCNQAFTGGNPRANACSPECQSAKRRLTEARCRRARREREKETPAEKVCYRCREQLPASAFGKNIWRSDGLQGMCKPCRREYESQPEQAAKGRERKASWYLLHFEAERAKQHARYHSDPEFRARQNQATLARYVADPKRIIDRRREQRQQRRAWEKEGARFCFCGRALPAGDAEGPWFCRPACKVACIRQITGGELRELLLRLRAGSDEQRIPKGEEQLIEHVARRTASLWFGKGDAVGHADLLSHAYLGAWSAWLTYDETRGASLHTWLITGARREVLEARRAADPLSRGERKRYREARSADPNTPPPRTIVSLDAITREDEGGDLLLADCLLAEAGPDMLERIHAKQTAARIFALFRPSEKRLAEVVRLVGMEGLTMGQVGVMMGLSESRVRQLWSEARARIVSEVSA